MPTMLISVMVLSCVVIILLIITAIGRKGIRVIEAIIGLCLLAIIICAFFARGEVGRPISGLPPDGSVVVSAWHQGDVVILVTNPSMEHYEFRVYEAAIQRIDKSVLDPKRWPIEVNRNYLGKLVPPPTSHFNIFQ